MKSIILIFALLYTSQSIAMCKVKLRVNDSPPNYYLDSNQQWQGVSVALASAIITQAGCTIDYVKAPFKRALRYLASGHIDMMTNLSWTKEREIYIDFFGVQRSEKVIVIVPQRSSYALTSLDDFIGLDKPVAYFNGAFYGSEFANKLQRNKEFAKKLVPFNSIENMLKALRKGRLSGVIYDASNAEKILTQKKMSQKFSISPFVIYENNIYYGLSKKSVSKELKNKLQQAYLALQDSGKLQQIIQAH